MTKKGVSSGGGNIPSAMGLLLKDTMTAIIQVKNENGAVLCSDTWNHGNENHYTQKIFFNKANHVMIAQAGDNGILFEDGYHWLISEILQDFCDNFIADKSDKCIKILNESLGQFIDNINLDINHKQALSQYILVYLSKDNKIETFFFEYTKIFNISSPNTLFWGKNNLNEYCFYIGIEMRKKFDELLSVKFPEKTLSQLQDYAINYIAREIQTENNKPDEERLVGGQIHYVTMDQYGNIGTNIQSLKTKKTQ